TLQIAQYHSTLTSTQAEIVESHQGFSDPLVTLVLKLDIRGRIQEGTDLVQGLNLLVVHISHHG
ncbi:MAG: hypothetical protein KZQ59_18695, partial [Candidatus Thiodiazotropha sp. (ex Lucinoma aequizonata)]|nr:hypothetical protein [Candidatus Thiodiazotropha sp. (ex Lucinoma aequizonata)]